MGVRHRFHVFTACPLNTGFVACNPNASITNGAGFCSKKVVTFFECGDFCSLFDSLVYQNKGVFCALRTDWVWGVGHDENGMDVTSPIGNAFSEWSAENVLMPSKSFE